MRCFVSLNLPESVQDRLCACMGDVRGADWEEPSRLHLTLRFVGEIPEERVVLLERALEEIRLPAFELELRGVGHFPLRGVPRVLWAGVEPGEELERLQRRIERAVRSCALPAEGRNFHPHVTLARVERCPQDDVAGFLMSRSLLRLPPFAVEHFHLMESRTSPWGSQYRELATCELL